MLGLILEIATEPATQASAVDFTWLFIKMLGALIVVSILAVIIIRYVVPRASIFRKFAGGKYIEIIARQTLDQKKNLYLVKVGNKFALLGSSDHNVNFLMEVKRSEVDFDDL